MAFREIWGSVIFESVAIEIELDSMTVFKPKIREIMNGQPREIKSTSYDHQGIPVT